MKHVPQLSKICRMTMGVVALFTASACGQQEHPVTVSDFCLNAKRISAEPHPNERKEGQPDPTNDFDTDMTVGEILAHNAAVDRLCPGGVQ